jgi:chromate transporter
MSDVAPAKPEQPNKPTLPDLFIAFAIISLSGFGGILAWSHRMLVEERKWMTPEEFNDAYALSQFLPGPNVINLSVVFGRQIAGVPGAVAAIAGLVGPGFLTISIASVLYALFGELDVLQRMFAGVAAAAAGLTISTGVKLAEPMVKDRDWAAPLVALAVLIAIGVLRWPAYWVLAVALPASVALVWWRQP